MENGPLTIGCDEMLPSTTRTFISPPVATVQVPAPQLKKSAAEIRGQFVRPFLGHTLVGDFFLLTIQCFWAIFDPCPPMHTMFLNPGKCAFGKSANVSVSWKTRSLWSIWIYLDGLCEGW
jgi:hypothetical protein